MSKQCITALIAIAALLPATAPEAGEQPVKFIREPDSVYVGTPHDIVSAMLKMAGVKKSDMVYDLGCGDGRIVVLAAQKYGCRGKGYELDPGLVTLARQNVQQSGVAHLVNIEQGDIFQIDFGDADVLPLYLLPDMIKRLVPKFNKLKPGSRLVLHNDHLEGIEPDKTAHVYSNEDNVIHNLFLYTLPLKPASAARLH